MKSVNATDGRLLPLLPWMLMALGVGIAAHLTYFPLWVSLLVLGCALWRWIIEKNRWHLPPGWLRSILAFVMLFAVITRYGGISGVGPGTALLAVMAALKLLETRTRRDFFAVLLIALFLVLSGLLREQYIWSLAYLVVALWLIATAWLNAARRRAPAGVAASLGQSARLLGHAVPIMVFLWVLFPRVPGPFWAIPTEKGAARSGLSETLSPGDITELSKSDAVAFRVRFDEDIPEPAERYWRGIVMANFNGRSWSGSPSGFMPDPLRNVTMSGKQIRYTVTLEPTRQRWIFALDLPARWEGDKIIMGTQYQLTRTDPVSDRLSYSATSYLSYIAGAGIDANRLNYYRRLPQQGNPRTREFAEQQRRIAGSDEAFVDRILQYFSREDFYYTLQPPALGKDSIDDFLFSSRRGFCEHYASSFATLLRAANIPARIVTGYQGGEKNPVGDYMIVRQSDAHAWTEAWLPGRGWVRIDPTAAVAAERIDSGLTAALESSGERQATLFLDNKALKNLLLTWDSVKVRWNEWVLGYGPDTQRDFMRWLGIDDPRWEKLISLLIGALTVSLLALSAWLGWRFRPPQQDPAAKAYRKFIKKLGVDRAPGEAPGAYALRASQLHPGQKGHIQNITRLYLNTRYGFLDQLEQLEIAVKLMPARSG